MTNDEMTKLTADTDNKSEKIRRLFRAGVETARIGDFLGIRYQHTYNVLLRAGLIVKAAEREAQAARAGDTIVLSLEAGGIVRLPADMLAEQELGEGDRLVCRSGPDGLMIMSRQQAVEHLRQVARSRMPEESGLLEALLGPNRSGDTGKPPT